MTEKKMRVVWLCGLPEIARLEVFAEDNIPSEADWSWIAGHIPPPRDIDFHMVCCSRKIERDFEVVWRGTTIHLLKVPRGGSWFLYEGWMPKIKRKVRELAPDIVHGWGSEGGYGQGAVRAAPDRHIVAIQGVLADFWPYLPKTPELFLNVIRERRLWGAAKCFVAESEYSKESVSRYTRRPISVIPHPLREQFAKASVGGRKEKVMVFLGLLDDRKGFRDAVRAFLSINEDWKLTCVGSPYGYSMDEQSAFVAQLGGKGRVSLVGRKSPSEIVDIFKQSPIFLLPSYSDTGPTALKEALAMGLWPVCYDNTGPKELIERYGFGSLVKTGDVRELAATLEKIIREKPWRDEQRVVACSECIRTDLSPDRVWEQLKELYTTVIKK